MTPLIAPPGWRAMVSPNRNVWNGYFDTAASRATQVRARVRWLPADALWVDNAAGGRIGTARGLAAPISNFVPNRGYVRTYTTHWPSGLPRAFTVWISAKGKLARADVGAFN